MDKSKTFNMSYKSEKVNKPFLPTLLLNVSVPQHDVVVLKLNKEAEASTSMGSQLSLLAAGGDHHSVQATVQIRRGRQQGKAQTCWSSLVNWVTTATRKASFETWDVKQHASSMPVSVAWLLSSSRGSYLQ